MAELEIVSDYERVLPLQQQQPRPDGAFCVCSRFQHIMLSCPRWYKWPQALNKIRWLAYLFKWLSNELGTNLPCHFCVCLLSRVHKENIKTSVWDAFSVWELLGKLQGSAEFHSPLGLTSVKVEKERSLVPFSPLWICTLCLSRMLYLIENNCSVKPSLPFPFCGNPVLFRHYHVQSTELLWYFVASSKCWEDIPCSDPQRHRKQTNKQTK